jgi:Protein of unknown function (DUF3106)
MTSQLYLRRILRSALAAVLLSATTAMVAAQPAFMRRVGQVRGRAQRPGSGPRQGGGNQEHLKQWMDRHSNLSPTDQQRALENEPGFRNLPPQTQQAMRNRLTELNNMTPEQRRRRLERTEEMERLTPPQRQQVRDSAAWINSLPEDRRRLVARSFRDLREMPFPQRQAILNSDRFRGQFSDQERSTLSTLLSVEPYIPVQRPPNEAPSVGK